MSGALGFDVTFDLGYGSRGNGSRTYRMMQNLTILADAKMAYTIRLSRDYGIPSVALKLKFRYRRICVPRSLPE